MGGQKTKRLLSVSVMSLSALHALHLYYNSGGNLNYPHFSEKEIGAQRREVAYATKRCQPQDLILGLPDFINTRSLPTYLLTSLPKRTLL